MLKLQKHKRNCIQNTILKSFPLPFVSWPKSQTKQKIQMYKNINKICYHIFFKYFINLYTIQKTNKILCSKD